jgi:leucyl/phenylalanyl-tRNA--protein transferase
MIERCRDLGFSIFDAQIMNPHLRSLGAIEISHQQFMLRLRAALGQRTLWSPNPHPQRPLEGEAEND